MTPRPRVQVKHREWIVPASPTPSQKKTTALSDWDTVMYKSYTPLLLFYTNDEKNPDFMNTETLKSSLSAVLEDFYPLAGRLVDIGNGRDEIDNCDAGVLFQEADYEGELERFKENGYLPNQMDYHRMFPIHFYCSPEDPLFAVQVTRFVDGGVALGIMILHKIADTYSACFFLDAWAKAARGSEYMRALFRRDLIEPPYDAMITDEAIAHYREEHRVIKHDESHLLRMDPNQQKYARTSPNGPMPLKSIILEFHSDGLYQCKKDAHTPDMIASKNWLSTKDALFAMLMRAIVRCRDVPSDDTEIKMIMSVNGRSKKGSNKELDYYFGNWMLSQSISSTKAKVQESSLVDAAVKFRQVIGGVKPSLFHGISKLYTLHEDMSINYLSYKPNSNVQTTASDVSMLPFWRLDFGFGRPDRTRGYITFGGNGCMIMFGRGDGTKGPMYDVQLQMDADSMGRFIEDPDVQKYANNILF
ncbi:hydroxycinnamoyl CoA shikimate/quinate hydroxycinnamoyltransferase isoform 1 [Mucor ambiguus]|uniref:Hydroxycinnamoyl CoA shikimate/quinate hydroxycinnamoyltransferase isoform 1 n=1 Tax=Mucor ambiguus TaxID=91626 RepID=A0A0C9MQ96_9FUNG|nr:hydroxycinnamoyl CoA shikimate/quinate hydroxycinnamoyltransferase isoform 1 [Mucor ambiguus]